MINSKLNTWKTISWVQPGDNKSRDVQEKAESFKWKKWDEKNPQDISPAGVSIYELKETDRTIYLTKRPNIREWRNWRGGK